MRLFVDSAGKGPRAAIAVKTVETAAAAFPQAHHAVRSIVAAAGRGGAVVGEGGTEPASSAVNQDGWITGRKDRAVIRQGMGGRQVEDLAGAEIDANGTGSGRGRGRGGRAGEAAAVDILAMEREDALSRASTCREALRKWWELQRAAVEEGLQDREREAVDRMWVQQSTLSKT